MCVVCRSLCVGRWLLVVGCWLLGACGVWVVVVCCLLFVVSVCCLFCVMCCWLFVFVLWCVRFLLFVVGGCLSFGGCRSLFRVLIDVCFVLFVGVCSMLFVVVCCCSLCGGRC